MITFDQFYKNIGLTKYPFTNYTTELEIENSKELFTPPTEHGPIIESFQNSSSMIVLGERGVGKTAIKEEFSRNISKRVNIIVADYEELSTTPANAEIYLLIINHLIVNLVQFLNVNPLKVFKINKQDKVYLSYLVYYFADIESLELIKENVAKVQNNIIKRCVCLLYNNSRSILNCTGTVLENALRRYVAQFFGHIPFYNENEITEFFPEIKIKTYIDFEKRKVSFKDLEKLCNLIINITGNKPVLLFDKLVEDNRIKNDADLISLFIENFLSDTKLLSLSKIQLVYFIWSTPYRFIMESIRSQKFYTPTIKWDNEHLKNVLDRRLFVYSNGKITDILQITQFQSKDQLFNYIKITNGVPRDLWHYLNKVFEEQYSIDKNSNRLSINAFDNALNRLVSETNYYEYYPRKSNSRSDSMDIYSYFGYLFKMKQFEFTKSEFRDKGGAGGSTNNYLIGMERIGLIEQRNMGKGKVMYFVRDNKIIYAVQNKIDIRKSNS